MSGRPIPLADRWPTSDARSNPRNNPIPHSVPPPSPEAHAKTSLHRRALPLHVAHPRPDATILALHNSYFGAYNTCDLATFGAFTDEHVEFYHDTGGITLGRDALVKSIHDNICGKTTTELVPGSFKTFHMNNIGAIENATLRFHHPGQPASEDVGQCETVILWRFQDNAWKVTRVYSYDHHNTKPTDNK
jgi:hypothetical protein